MARLLAVAWLVVAVLAGCSDNPSHVGEVRTYFTQHKIGSSADYALIKWGNIEDHVATTHGFADDQAACLELAQALNANACRETGGQECKNPFSCVSLNK
ncbi:MAG: hypothetical protein ACOY5C_12260 [Pseudomonadota bacterium]